MEEPLLIHGDCLEVMPQLSSASIDLILADLPYKITRNKWDTFINFMDLWHEYERLITSNGAIVLFGQGLFSAKLILSNEKLYRYSLVWNKVIQSGFLNSGKMPLRVHEDIHIFYKKLPVYNPQFTKGKPDTNGRAYNVNNNNNYGDYGRLPKVKADLCDRHPLSIVTFAKPRSDGRLHPTQKPVALLEWIIKTYTNEGQTVLDNVMGSGSSIIAAINTNRKSIGIEKDEKYFVVASNRIDSHKTLPLDKSSSL